MYSNPFASYAPAQLASPSAPFFNGTSYNRPAQVYNPAGQVANNAAAQTTVLPYQQIIQVNGKAGIDTLRMAPNSSALVMDMTAPIVWVCVSDGVGYVTPTPYDISLHEDAPAPAVNMTERLTAIETTLAEVQERIKQYESNVREPKSE